MIRTMFSYLKKGNKTSHKKLKIDQPLKLKTTEAVYRDELRKKQLPPCKAGMKKRVRFADSDPTILGEDKLKEEEDFEKRSCVSNDFGEKEGIRVKVKLTKEQAAQMLSKCNNGGFLEFKDLASELLSIPVNRVSIVST